MSVRISKNPLVLCCIVGVALAAQLGTAAAGEEIWPLSKLPAGSSGPVPLRRELPDYPPELASLRLEGRVVLEYVIDPAGRVINPVVVSSNNPWFERPALNAVLQWTYKPGEVGGQKVAVRVRQELDFEMKKGLGRNLWQGRGGTKQDNLPENYRWARPPEPVNTSFAVYPFAALRAGATGKARINFVVGPNGRVMDSAVLEATAPEFGAAMQAMIDTWLFTPPTKKDNSPCYALLSMQCNFDAGEGVRTEVPVTVGTRRLLQVLEKSPEKIVELAALDQPPKPLSRRPPVYPSAMLAERTRGSAVIEFFIDEAGDVQLPAIVSTTAPAFGYAAVQAIATWRFEPPRQGGKPVAVRARLPLDFEP